MHSTAAWSSWIATGAWIANICVIVLLRFGLAVLPGISTEASWTLTNLGYNAATFLMFHWMSGTPFNHNQNELDGMTLWEQIDGGAQFTPTKKYLTAVPIFMFLLSTHYTHYDATTFTINLISLIIVLIAKLPVMHRVRLFGFNKHDHDDEDDGHDD
ncbi:ORMDL family [Entophlyctis helioformis]|nr:ORMDL family [Entophlyctis helioformis]